MAVLDIGLEFKAGYNRSKSIPKEKFLKSNRFYDGRYKQFAMQRTKNDYLEI